MPTEPTVITDSNQDMDELLSAVAEIAERTKRIEGELTRLLSAWSAGGLRGLREAARGTSNGQRH